jgi:hypothetical protein
VSGSVADDAGNLVGVLTALAPETGEELPNARQTPINVPVVLYDGLRDLWFVIREQHHPQPDRPRRPAHEDARPGDGDVDGAPVDRGTAPRHRSRCAAHQSPRLRRLLGGLGRLVTVDTTDPRNLGLLAATPLPQQPFGLIATRSQTGNGGDVNLLLSQACPGADAGQCLAVQHAAVPNDVMPATLTFQVSLGPFFGKPAFGSYLAGGPEDVILWSSPGGDPSAPGPTSLNTYSPQNETPIGAPISFVSHDGFFQPLAFAECQQGALLTATNEDLAVYAIPLGGPMAARAALAHSGQSVSFEPYTKTVLAPFTQGDGYEFTAFTLGGTAANPTLAPRQNWSPPADVRPLVLGIREPVPVQCPP